VLKYLNLIRPGTASLIAIATISMPAPSFAQNAANDDASERVREIVVTANRISGSVIY
jgi:hypothetical protein